MVVLTVQGLTVSRSSSTLTGPVKIERGKSRPMKAEENIILS